MNKKYLAKSVLSTLGLTSSICVLWKIEASAAPGKVGVTALMTRLALTGEGFIRKGGLGSTIVKLQKSGGGSSPSTHRLSLRDGDKIYKTGNGGRSTKLSIFDGNSEVFLGSEEGLHIVTKSGSGVSKDIFVKPGNDSVTVLTQKFVDGNGRIKEIRVKNSGDGSPSILTRESITVNENDGTHRSVTVSISSTNLTNPTGQSRTSYR